MPFIFLPFIRVNPCPSVVKIFVFFAFFAAISGFGCGLPRGVFALNSAFFPMILSRNDSVSPLSPLFSVKLVKMNGNWPLPFIPSSLCCSISLFRRFFTFFQKIS